MVTVYWKIDHTPFDNGLYSTTTTLTEYHKPIINTALGDNRDSFEFKVDNFQDEYSNMFSPKDKVTIYRQVDSNTGWASADILMTGVIRDTPEDYTYNKAMIAVKGYNHSEAVTDALVFVDGTTGAYDVPQFIQACLNSVTNYNSNFAVTWDPSNPTTKSDGTAFPTVNEYAFNKSLSYILEKYSGRQNNEDTEYYWYVDKDNKLIWKPRTDVVSGNYDASSGTHLKLSVKKDTKDVKNFIIVKAGLDPRGNPIQSRYADYSSIAKHGFKYHFIVDENKTAQSLLDLDRSDFGVDAMADASYPLTPRWSGSSFASYSDYVDGFRVLIKSYAEGLGKSYADIAANGKIKVDFEFIAGEKNWRIGDVISCNIPTISASTQKNLRVDSAQFTSTTDTFTLTEDFGSI